MQNHAQPSETLRAWLSHTGSLTHKLEGVASDVQIDVLSQGWTQPGWWGRYTLKHLGDRVFLREVIIRAGDIPCWYARTIIPEATYTAHDMLFKRLNEEPLTDLIFKGQDIIQDKIKYYPVDKTSLMYYWYDITPQDKPLWARQTHLRVKEQDSFHLVELFLPSFLEMVL